MARRVGALVYGVGMDRGSVRRRQGPWCMWISNVNDLLWVSRPWQKYNSTLTKIKNNNWFIYFDVIIRTFDNKISRNDTNIHLIRLTCAPLAVPPISSHPYCFGAFLIIWTDLMDHKTRKIAKLGPKRPRVGNRLTFWYRSEFQCHSKSNVKRIPTIGPGGSKM